MFRHICLCSIVAAFVVMPVALRAADDDEGEKAPAKKPSAEEAMAKYANNGPGVYVVKKAKGRILKCVVVGQARISTVLGKSKGLELARNKANLDCSAQFVKWLKEEVTAYESADEQSVTLMEGAENKKDGDSQTESGKAIENQSKKMDSLAKGLVRGLRFLHKQIDGEGKTYTIVKGWDADTNEGAKKLAADLSSDAPAKSEGASSDTGEKKAKKGDKHIKSDSSTSDDADDFVK